MSDLDVIAVTATPRVGSVCNRDRSVCGSKNGRASGSRNIGTTMIRDLAGERILPIAEQRRDRVALRKRPLENTDSLPIRIWVHDLPSAADKAAEKLCP